MPSACPGPAPTCHSAPSLLLKSSPARQAGAPHALGLAKADQLRGARPAWPSVVLTPCLALTELSGSRAAPPRWAPQAGGCCFLLPCPLLSPLGPRLRRIGIPQAWASLPGVPSRSKRDPGLTFTSRPFYHCTWSPTTWGLHGARFQDVARHSSPIPHPFHKQDPNSLGHRPWARRTDVAPSLAHDSVFHLQDFAQRVPSTSEVHLLLLCPQDTPAYVTDSLGGSAHCCPWATPLTVWLS